MANNMDTFNSLKNRDRSFLIAYCKKLYNQLEKILESTMGSAGGFFTTIRITCAMIASDGNISRDEYNAFVEFSQSSCSYDEFYETACGVSKDFFGAIDEIRAQSADAVGATYALAMGIFALKGYMSQYENNFIEYLVR